MDGDYIISDLDCYTSGGLLEGGTDPGDPGSDTGVFEEKNGKEESL